MESTGAMPWVSFRQNPRSGQVEVWAKIDQDRCSLNIKLPTGYGKTYTMAGVYSILQKQNRANRLLVIFPYAVQIDQFKNDGWGDLRDALVEPFSSVTKFLDEGNKAAPTQLEIIDLRNYSTSQAISRHKSNTAQIFVTTVQSLTESRGMNLVKLLLQTGKWMICVDEYHHYGIDRSWGNAVLSLEREFLLAMSATPSRPEEDSAFGPPEVIVTYRQADKERAVKPLRGHSYAYKVDAVTDDGDIVSFSTSELIAEAGGDSPEKIERLVIKRKMRWSPKYVSPLVSVPIDRAISQRLRTGYPLQVLIGAMCVSHAELICKQVRDMYPELRVEWVGTGESGRSEDVNKAIIKKFCPPKDEHGHRPTPEIDVLVHVGIAGEGLDSIYVAEVSHLNSASLCNKRNQENGRAARYLDGVMGHINFDSSSEFSKYVGDAIMDAMDNQSPKQTDDDGHPPIESELPLLPDWPEIRVYNIELIGIDSGDPAVQLMAKALQGKRVATEHGTLDLSGMWKEDGTPNKDNSGWDAVIQLYRGMRSLESSLYNREAEIRQWQEAVKLAMTSVAGRVVKMMVKSGSFEKSLPGDIKRRINTRKKRFVGAADPTDIEICKKHYQWVKELEVELVKSGIPSWLW